MAANIITRMLLFSTDDDQWSLVPALTWIATRSLKFAEAYASREPSDADALLALARAHGGMPRGVNLGEAFDTLGQKIDADAIRGRATKLKWVVPQELEQIEPAQYFSLAPPPERFEVCDFRPQELRNRMVAPARPLALQDFAFHDGDCLTPNGSGYGSPNPNGSRVRWSWQGMTFPRDDLLRLWPDFPCVGAWKLAKSQPWHPPKNLSPEWLNNLSAGQYLSVAAVVNMLAFGPDGLPIGLDAPAEHAARLRAGLALLSAANCGKVGLIGHATFRLPHFRGGLAPASALSKIEPEDLNEKTLVIDGAPDWLGPVKYAEEYPEQGQATESVTFVGVAVHRDSLRRWLAGLSTTALPRKRGPKPKFDWAAIEAESIHFMDYHGDFSADDPEWNAQARLESKLLAFCGRRFGREPSVTQLRAYLPKWLNDWREKRR
jgi:hypothetical protein